MLKKLLILFGLLIIATTAASWLAQQQGDMQINWLGWRLQLPTSLAVVFVVLFGILLVFFDRIWRAILGLPGWLGGRLHRRRDVAGHRALTLGLMAVSAGEPAEAQKQAGRAQRLLKAPQLTGLLAAQAAHLAGDHQAARRYFLSILDDRETAFLGQIGLMRLALDEGDTAAARAAAQAALDLKPTSALAAGQLVRLEADRANWQAALPAMDVINRHQANAKAVANADVDTARRQRCAINYLAALDLIANDRPKAITHLLGAIKADPKFLPASITLANLYLDDDAAAKATKILQAVFRKTPHNDIVDGLGRAWQGNDGQFMSRMIKLLNKVEAGQKSHAYNIVAAAAAARGLDGEAVRLRDEANQLANNDEDDDNLAAIWQCASCKSLHDAWQSHCLSCNQFASLSWQQPERRVTPLITTA